MISYEVVEKIMKFSKIKIFFRSGDQKTRFSTTKFQGVFGSKTTFSQKFPENRNFAELLTGFLICKSFNHKKHIFNDFWPKFGRIFKIRINKIENFFFQGPKMAKNRFSQKWPRSVVDAQNWSQIIFQDLGKSFQAIFHHFS